MFWTFNNERGGIVVELIYVCLEPTVLSFLEVECECVKEAIGAKPDVSPSATIVSNAPPLPKAITGVPQA